VNLTTPTMTSYALFPDWVFEGTLSLDTEQKAVIMNHATKMEKADTHFGWITKRGQLKGEALKLSNIIGNMFFDNVVNHFQTPAFLRNIDITENQFVMIKPNCAVPISIERYRWYTAVVFMDGDPDGSQLYFDQISTKLYATPSPKIQEFTHYVEYAPLKVVFFPSHIPWGFTPNKSNKNCLYFTCSFYVNPPKQKRG
jgi:hypothetical protein